MPSYRYRLRKVEHLCSRKLIDTLFTKTPPTGSNDHDVASHRRSFFCFPLRALIQEIEPSALNMPDASNALNALNATDAPDKSITSITPIAPHGAPNRSKVVPVQVLFSVSKRHFKHAVDRNRAKRQMREAYRLHRAAFMERVTCSRKNYVIAFLWTSGTPQSSAQVWKSMEKCLAQLTEFIAD